MGYSKNIWKEDGTTPITASRLNWMEAGIDAALSADITNAGSEGMQINFNNGFKAIICELNIPANTAGTFTYPTGYFSSFTAPPILTTSCPNGAYSTYSIADQVSVYAWGLDSVTVSNWDGAKQAVVYALVFGK